MTETKPKTCNGALDRLPRALTPLTEHRRWVVWAWEQRSDKSGIAVKWTKPPRHARTLKLASSNDATTWAAYDDAVRRWERGDADGIGYMLSGAQLGALDLDKCCQYDPRSKEVEVDDWAEKLCDDAQAYCEITPSGGGLRILGEARGGNLQRKVNLNPKTGAAVEFFRNTNRFITISGLKYGRCDKLPIIDNFIDETFASYYSERRGRPQTVCEPSTRTDYDSIIRNGVPVGQRNEAFQAVVWHLANQLGEVDNVSAHLIPWCRDRIEHAKLPPI